MINVFPISPECTPLDRLGLRYYTVCGTRQRRRFKQNDLFPRPSVRTSRSIVSIFRAVRQVPGIDDDPWSIAINGRAKPLIRDYQLFITISRPCALTHKGEHEGGLSYQRSQNRTQILLGTNRICAINGGRSHRNWRGRARRTPALILNHNGPRRYHRYSTNTQQPFSFWGRVKL